MHCYYSYIFFERQVKRRLWIYFIRICMEAAVVGFAMPEIASIGSHAENWIEVTIVGKMKLCYLQALQICIIYENVHQKWQRYFTQKWDQFFLAVGDVIRA